MDKIQSFMKGAFRTIKNAVQHAINQCSELYQKHLDSQKQSTQYEQEITVEQRRFDIQLGLQQELVFVLSQTNLPSFVQPIHMAGHILPDGYSVTTRRILYRFRMSANSIPSMYVLRQLKNLINRSIKNAQNLLYFCDGLDSSETHPFIFYGMYVVDIVPCGQELALSVVTRVY